MTLRVVLEGPWLSLGIALGAALALPMACGGSTSGGPAPSCDGGVFCSGTGASGGSGGMGGVLTGGSGGMGGGTGGGAPGTAHPPDADPSAPAASASTPTTLAVQQLFLGDSDSMGNPDPNAWRHIGYDIDGLWSTKNDYGHCKPQEGATKSSVQTDGEGGIDNSFGSNLMPIFGSLYSNMSQQVTAAIQGGEFTLLIHLSNFASQPPSQNAIVAALYNGATTSQAPNWNGTDVWPVSYESVDGGNIASPKVMLPASYLVNGTWVSDASPFQGTLTLELRMPDGFAIVLPITHLRVTAAINGSGMGATGNNGVLSGILATEVLISELKKTAGGIDPNLCEGATFDSIAQQIRAASDIMADGTNGDPSKICDGISIGLGFEARAVQLGPVAAQLPPPPDPCAF